MIVQKNDCENNKVDEPGFGAGAKRIENCRATHPVIETA